MGSIPVIPTVLKFFILPSLILGVVHFGNALFSKELLMGEVRRKVKMIQVDMLCDNCHDGYMRPIKDAKATAGYVHMCDACAIEAIYPVRYPYVEVIRK